MFRRRKRCKIYLFCSKPCKASRSDVSVQRTICVTSECWASDPGKLMLLSTVNSFSQLAWCCVRCCFSRHQGLRFRESVSKPLYPRSMLMEAVSGSRLDHQMRNDPFGTEQTSRRLLEAALIDQPRDAGRQIETTAHRCVSDHSIYFDQLGVKPHLSVLRQSQQEHLSIGLPRSSGPVSVLVHGGSWRYGLVGRRSGSGWRSRPLDDLRCRGAIPQ